MTRSLKSRMLSASALWIVVAWSASLAMVYAYPIYSEASIWDERLESVAVKLLQMMPSLVPSSTQERRAEVVARNNELTFQLWSDTGQLLASTSPAPRQPLRADFVDGFANVEIDGQTWRVFSTSDSERKVRVQVGNPRDMINADFQKHALKAVSLAAVPLALGGLLLWWAVQRALTPLARIEATARERSMFDLRPLPTQALPAELVPLIHSFNHVLGQLDQAIQAERRFIGDAAHELRTPLSALQAQLEVAMRATSVEEKNVALAKLQIAVRRSSRLSEQLLDLARLEAGERAPLRDLHDLDEIVRHVASEFEVSAQLQHRNIELAIEPCRIQCEMDEVGILVRNLIDNALRYTFAGGTVRIACGYRGSGDTCKAFVEVADDGPGVPAAEQSAIFERFHRAKGSTAVRGSGIGLSLVARIASMHQAQIETGAGIGNPGLAVRVLFPCVTSGPERLKNS
jgi:signal transduction histidine kinase